jgi:hypothetical protein
MAPLSLRTQMMAIQAVNAEIKRITAPVAGNLSKLEPDNQELLMSYSLAAMELKEMYFNERKSAFNFPSYEQLVGDVDGDATPPPLP